MKVIFLRIKKFQCDVDCIVVRVFILIFFALTLAIFLVIALIVFTVTIIAVLSVFCLSTCP